MRKEGQRRRIPSTNRPLSSISDTPFDPFDLLGLNKAENGQYISYGHLLVPSKEKKYNTPCNMISEVNIDMTNINAARNYGVAK